MQLPRIFNLGEILVAQAVVADCPMTKEALGKALGTSRPSISRYSNVCYWEVPDFRLDYPELPKDQWLKRRSKHDRQVPLTPYQIWVVSAVQICFQTYHKEIPVREYIKANGYVFSRSRYESRLRQLAKEAQSA